MPFSSDNCKGYFDAKVTHVWKDNKHYLRLYPVKFVLHMVQDDIKLQKMSTWNLKMTLNYFERTIDVQNDIELLSADMGRSEMKLNCKNKEPTSQEDNRLHWCQIDDVCNDNIIFHCVRSAPRKVSRGGLQQTSRPTRHRPVRTHLGRVGRLNINPKRRYCKRYW